MRAWFGFVRVKNFYTLFPPVIGGLEPRIQAELRHGSASLQV
jgi:hypothetical protein